LILFSQEMSGRGRGRAMVMPAWMEKDQGHGSAPPRGPPPPQLHAYPGQYEQQQPPPQYEYALPPLGSRVGRFTVQVDPASGMVYYWDPMRRTAQWETPRPPAPPPPLHEMPPLPSSAWIEVFDDNTGRCYWWNEETDAVSWTLPRR